MRIENAVRYEIGKLFVPNEPIVVGYCQFAVHRCVWIDHHSRRNSWYKAGRLRYVVTYDEPLIRSKLTSFIADDAAFSN